jgi:hypothetical protein
MKSYRFLENNKVCLKIEISLKEAIQLLFGKPIVFRDIIILPGERVYVCMRWKG